MHLILSIADPCTFINAYAPAFQRLTTHVFQYDIIPGQGVYKKILNTQDSDR